jgi:hypothetical protein
MNRYIPLLKSIAAQVAYSHKRARFPGLQDFLLDSVGEEDNVASIASKILVQFCIEDGQFNGSIIGVSLAVRFLDETLTSPPAGDVRSRSLKDLHSVLSEGGPIEEFLKWIDIYYK